jgi:hypothetical protein
MNPQYGITFRPETAEIVMTPLNSTYQPSQSDEQCRRGHVQTSRPSPNSSKPTIVQPRPEPSTGTLNSSTGPEHQQRPDEDGEVTELQSVNRMMPLQPR